MLLTAQFLPWHEFSADWLIVGIWDNEPLRAELSTLDERLGGTLSRLREAGDLPGKTNALTTLLDVKGLATSRLLLVGLGPRAGANAARLTDAAAAAARAVTGKQRNRVALAVCADVPGMDWAEVVLALGAGLQHGCYGPGLRKREPSRFAPHELWLVAPTSAPREAIVQAAHRAAVEGRAVALARELVNTPPCDLYPESFAERARQVAAKADLSCTVLDEWQIEAERMGALFAVARGSDQPPRVVVLHYQGGTTAKTLGLVGKGVTFDSGGLSLKNTEGMLDMKCDMAGAATVLAAMLAIAELRLPVNVLGVLALVENMPGGSAMKLGDVLHARNGKTIEVHNTDAEGRLILADALAYAVDRKVSHLVDLATLTGACMVALGYDVAGLMSNDEAWSNRVLSAARRVGEKAWPLPMFPHYGDMIKSQVADIKNTGGTRYAGAISAAKFLEEFVGPTPWAHLDIAGPAWAEHEDATRDPGGTGCFVRTLVELARDYGP